MTQHSIRPVRAYRPNVVVSHLSRCTLPLLFVLGAGGCYGYYPTVGAQPAGRDVQLTLTDSGTVALAAQIGPSAEAVSGHVKNDSPNGFELAVYDVRQRDGNEISWKGERILVPRPLIAKVEQRRFSRARTSLFSGAIAIALVSLRQAFQGTGGSSPGGGLPGGGVGK